MRSPGIRKQCGDLGMIRADGKRGTGQVPGVTVLVAGEVSGCVEASA